LKAEASTDVKNGMTRDADRCEILRSVLARLLDMMNVHKLQRAMATATAGIVVTL
jgi:hypothetical protein